MKSPIIAACCFLLVCGLAGCGVFGPPPATPDPLDQEMRDTLREDGLNICRDMIQAVRDDDYETFSAWMTPGLREQLTQLLFDRMIVELRRSRRSLSEYDFLIELHQSDAAKMVWLAVIAPNDPDDPSGPTQHLITVSLMVVDGRYRVSGFGIL